MDIVPKEIHRQSAREKMLNIISHQGNHNHNERQHFIRSCQLKSEETLTSVGEDRGKLEPLYTGSGNVKQCFSHFGIVVVAKKKLKPYDPAIPLLGIIPKRIHNICPMQKLSQVFLAALFIITKKVETTAELETIAENNIRTMEYYSTMKGN